MTEFTRSLDITRDHLIAAGLVDGASKECKSLALHILAEQSDVFTGPELLRYAERILRPLSGVEVQARFSRVMAVMSAADDFHHRMGRGALTNAEAVAQGRAIAASLDAAFANCFRDYHTWGRGI